MLRGFFIIFILKKNEFWGNNPKLDYDRCDAQWTVPGGEEQFPSPLEYTDRHKPSIFNDTWLYLYSLSIHPANT
jgi:hypothetical protein